MAVITAGPLIGEIRGSMGGTTFSRNRYGMYTRTRAVPVNPNSARQVAARDRFNTLATYWRDTLTKAQRDAWDLYAANTNWTNAVGQVVNLTGLNHFLRCNNMRLVVGRAITVAAPVIFGIPDQEDNWNFAADSTTQDLTITYGFGTDVDDQDYAFYQGQPVDGSRTFFAGPWRGLGNVIGDNGNPPASPKVAAAVYPIGVGQRSFVYVRRIDDDARVTQPFRRNVIVT